MASSVDRSIDRKLPRAQDGSALSPTFWSWAAVASLLAVLWALGISPNSDIDDILKIHEIRTFVSTGAIFDRILPGIQQPEPLVSHWSWLADLPYGLVVASIAPFIGSDAALSVAGFIVPLLLLWPAIFFLYRIVVALGFERPGLVHGLLLIAAARPLFEFSPGRVDYHNIGILLLLASLALTIRAGSRAALVNGAVTALLFAVSPEFALFACLAMEVHVCEFIMGAGNGTSRLKAFGVGLALSALLLFAITVPPEAYRLAVCDRYSASQTYALVSAGASFVIAAALLRSDRDWLPRAAVVVLMAGVSLAGLAVLFPECLGGPFSGLSDYVRENWLFQIDQEKNLFQRPDFVLSPDIAMATILFIGALAPGIVALTDRGKNRALVIFAVFALLALAHSVAYFRYFRYLSLFGGVGLIFICASFAPALRASGGLLAGQAAAALPPRLSMIFPGAALAAVLVLFHLVNDPAEARIPAAQVAGGCDDQTTPANFDWPSQSRVLAPPVTGLRLLAAAPGNPTVVAIPFHSAAPGIERSYRFFDPETPDPRVLLDQSGATHVVVCAWRGEHLPLLHERYPLTAALMEGRPPEWLVPCQDHEGTSLRIYRYRKEGRATLACPTVLPSPTP